MRLLVVEDEKILNKTISERLTRSGYSIDSCFDAYSKGFGGGCCTGT